MAPMGETVDDKAPQSTNVIDERESERPKLEEEPQDHGSYDSDSDSDDSCSYNDGRYYVPCSDEDMEKFLSNPDFVDDTLSKEDNEIWYSYLKQVRKSDGFDVDVFPRGPQMIGLRPVDLMNDESTMEAVTHCANYAIDRHNAEKPEKLELVYVTKANRGCSNPCKFLITMNARVIATGEIKIYQAHVEGFTKKYLFLFRPKPDQD